MLIKFIVIDESFTVFTTVTSGEHCANKELLNEPHTVSTLDETVRVERALLSTSEIDWAISLLWEICRVAPHPV